MKATELVKGEFNAYYKNYIALVGAEDLLDALKNGRREFQSLINSIPKAKLHFAYAENKWTIAEVLLHIIDTERVFQYRALCFSRLDTTPLPGFDQDLYVANAKTDTRSKKDLLEEFLAVRKATLKLFATFNETQMRFIGVASDSPMSSAATGFIICGHQKHHTQILLQRYLSL